MPRPYAPYAMISGTRQRGIALIGVLLGLTLLALFAAGLARDTRTEILLARNFLTAARAEAAADAALYRTIAEIAGSRDKDTGAPDDVRNSTIESRAGPIRISTSVADEGGKIDLNRAPGELLGRLLTQLDAADADALRDAILDFRDADDSARDNGAEWPAYRGAGLPYVPFNRPFRSIGELRLVLGMTEQIFRRLSPYVTVYSRRRGIDPNYAAEVVLRAVPSLDDDVVDDILSRRGAGEEPPAFNFRTPYLKRSTRRGFTIRATAVTPGGGRFLRHAVVELSGRGGAYRILVWRPGRADDEGADD